MKSDHEVREKQERGNSYEFIVPAERKGQRLDLFLAEMIPDASRSRLGNLVRSDGAVQVNGSRSKAGTRLRPGDRVCIIVPPAEPMEIVPEEVEFTLLHEDDDLLVIAKPPGIVVHPASGHSKGTLVHGILARCKTLSGISGVERPGIVHRLDKDTSGVMVVAKNDKSHHGLVELFKNRQVRKVYHSLVLGRPASWQGSVNKPIGRHRGNRKKMAVLDHGGRKAVTSWTTLEELAQDITYLEVRPETGRTHQIRVHMAYLGHPVAGDAVYSNKKNRRVTVDFPRQCLHAYSLSFKHPVTGEQVEFVAPLWPDMMKVLEELRKA